MSVSGRIPLPTLRAFVFASSLFMNSSFIFSCRISLLVAVQRCPAVPKAPHNTPSRASSRSASSMTITGFLPPSSRETRFMVFEHSSIIHFPVSRLPVKEIAFMRGCWTMAFPTVPPGPVTRFITPGDKPASISTSTNLWASRGVSLAGLKTIAFPVIRAGIIFQAGIAIGKFQGVIRPTTPIGLSMVIQNFSLSSEVVVSPSICLPSPAA